MSPVNFGTLTEIVAALLFIGAPVVAAIVVGVATRGRIRALALAGFGIFVLEGIVGTGWVFLYPVLANEFDIDFTVLAAGYSMFTGLLSMVGFALLALAVITDRSRQPEPQPADRY